MALGDAEKAAVKGFLQSKRGSRALQPHVVAALLTYFANKDMSLRELPTSPPPSKEEEEEWCSEWIDYAVDAGLTDSSDKNNFARWMRCSDASVPSGVRSGKARAVADALTRKGMAVDRAGELTIAAALLEADKGDSNAQRRCVEVVFLLYTGQSPGVEDRSWFTERIQGQILSMGGEEPVVDIRACPSYAKQHAKTRMPSLERALSERTGMLWQRYYQLTLERLSTFGFNLAAMAFMRVVNFARNQNMSDHARERQYLQNYFSVEHLGKGIPTEVCYKSALMLGGSAQALAASQRFDMMPTVPSEAQRYDVEARLAQMEACQRGWQLGMAPCEQQQPNYSQQLNYSQQQQQQHYGYAQQQMQMQMQMQQHHHHQQQQLLQQPQLPPPLGGKCAYCGSAKHATEKCTHMLKARKAFRAEQEAKEAGSAAPAAADKDAP